MRLFIASTFPDGILRDLNDRLSHVRSKLPSASWVRHETQHLTYAFLGEQPDSLVETIEAPLIGALGKAPTFSAVLHGCGFFPHPRHARVGWIGLEPEQKFADVAHAIRDVVRKEGVELDRADFKAHLTLLRMRDRWPPASIDLFQKTMRDYKSPPFTIDRVTLFSSQLNPKGAIHTPLREFAMAT
ncbi:MAG TPA: RNA 2',3'-cyclic phosphodiesterase [Thermoanaerobaculia bacterium]|nr:RNA 2',3'-cyclic phosphodiesterase [Thermoanaerobaculia bacterium]